VPSPIPAIPFERFHGAVTRVGATHYDPDDVVHHTRDIVP
jgi:hypothetical protein